MDSGDLTTDVVIVGSGPAGVSTAFTLGKCGINTILIDKKKLNKIGDKACGDALSPLITLVANEQIGLPRPNETTGELEDYCTIAILDGNLGMPNMKLNIESATVNRHLYGQALIKSLHQFDNVKLLPETRITSTLIKNDQLIGITCASPENKQFSIFSKVVVDASGYMGVVRRKLPKSMCTKFPQKIPNHQMGVAYREIIETKEPHEFQNQFYFYYGEKTKNKVPGYFWAFSKGKNRLNVGYGCGRTSLNKGEKIKETYIKLRNQYFPNSTIIDSKGGQVTSRLPLYSCVHNGFITVGDAAALVDPLTGDGHGEALLSGIQCGKAITKAITVGDVSERGMWSYNSLIWKKYGVKYSWGIGFNKFIRKHGIRKLNWLIKSEIMKAEDFESIINSPHQKSTIMRRAAKVWYKPFLLFSLFTLFRYIRSIQKHAMNYPEYNNFHEWARRVDKLENR